MLHQASNRFNAEDLWQKDHDHFLHPYTHFDSFKRDGSLVLVEGEGCHVRDANGGAISTVSAACGVSMPAMAAKRSPKRWPSRRCSFATPLPLSM